MSHVIQSRKTRISFFAIATLAVAALAVSFNHAGAQQQGGPQIGTYEPQQAFQMYHRTAEAQEEMQELQLEFQQQVQQQDQQDPQQLQQFQQQLQQRAEQIQQELIENFQNDVQQVAPELAEEAGVQIIAVEVVYPAQAETVDLTDQIIDRINEGHELPAQDELPPLPQP